MKKKLSPKKWFLGFLSITVLSCIVLSTITYFYDPACYYRLPSNRLIVNNFKFVNAGIARNAEYDSVIIGSSMSQNFKMDLFREKLGINPVKLAGGGVSIHTMEFMYNLVKREGRAKTVVCNIDLPNLNKDVDPAYSSYPTYLYDDNIFNDYKYLLGYETWMKLIPFNIEYNINEYLGEEIPTTFATHNIDTIGEWDSYAAYGKFTKNSYTEGMTRQNMENIRERMVDNANYFMDYLLTDSSETEFIIFFPPYSAMYWYDARACGHLEDFMEIKRYLVEELEKYPNVTIYDFQSMPETTELNNYKDITHYSGRISDMLVDFFAENKYIVTSKTIQSSIDELYSLIDVFAEKYQDILLD